MSMAYNHKAGADMEPTGQEEERPTERHLKKNRRTGDEERRAVLARSGPEFKSLRKTDLLHPYIPPRGLRSSYSGLLSIPTTNMLLCCPRSFSVAAPTPWNSLPPNIRNVSPVAVLLPPKRGTREYFLQRARPLSLDPNTMCKKLSLSVENRKVTGSVNYRGYTDHPERFTVWPQVLCREGQSACCYWEVEWSGSMVHTAVCYKDIQRKGGAVVSLFGFNNKSWCLESCRDIDYVFRHNQFVTPVSGSQSSRIGVYLDHKAGTLSFYSVSDTMTLLHTVYTTFTQALYPGIWVSCDGTAELMKIWDHRIHF